MKRSNLTVIVVCIVAGCLALGGLLAPLEHPLLPGMSGPQPAQAAPAGGKILWDCTHGLLDGNPAWKPAASGTNYSAWYNDMVSRGYTIKTTTAGVNNEDLSDYDVLVVNCLSNYYSAYTTAELKAIDYFVSHGGGLVVLGMNDLGSMPGVGYVVPVAQLFGTTINVAANANPSVPNVTSHELFAGVTGLSLMYPAGLTVAAPSQVVARDAGNTPVVSAAVEGDGKVVTVSDNLILYDGLYSGGNREFARNMFDWVSTPSLWTDPLALSDLTGSGSVRPRMAMGDDGTLHVVWGDLGTERRIYYRTRSSLGVWSNVTDVDGAASACNPEIAVAAGGTVHISWQDKRSGGWEVYYRSLSPDGVWTPALDQAPVLLSDGLGGSAGATLAAAGDGTLHAAWSDNSLKRVHYRTRSAAGTWSSLTNVAVSDGESDYPQVAVGPDGTLHMTYYSEASGEMLYRSRSAGGTWTPALESAGVNVSNNAGVSSGQNWFGIEAGDDGTVHTVWFDNTSGNYEIWYRSLSAEGEWTPALDMAAVNLSSNIGDSLYPDIALGDDGSVHVVWEDSEFGNWNVLYRSRSADGTWDSTPADFSHDPDRHSYYPAIATGSLHVTWMSQLISSGVKAVYYASAGPYRPANVPPVGWSVFSNLTPALEATAFSAPSVPATTHQASWWQITNVSGDYTLPVWESLADYTNLTSMTVPEGVASWGVPLYWHVRYQDGNGMWSSYSNQTFFVANRPPNQPSPTSPIGGTATDLTPTLQSSVLSDDDWGNTHAVSRWQVRAMSGSYSSPVWDSGEDVVHLTGVTIPSGVLSGGNTYYWRVRYRDQWGGWSAYSAEGSFLTDAVPPTVTITALSGPAGTKTPAFTGTVSDTYTAIDSVEYRVDGGTWTAATFTPDPGDPKTGSYSFTVPSQADGSHTVEVRALDVAGNLVTSYVGTTFIVDTAAPEVTPDKPSLSSGSFPRLTGSISAGGGTIVSVEYRVDGGAWQTAPFEVDPADSSTVTYDFDTFLLPGDHTVEIRATDDAGNVILTDFGTVALSIGGGASVGLIVGGVIGGLLLLGLAIYLILLWRTAIAEKAEAAAGGEIPSGSRLRRRMVPRMPGRGLKAKVAREVPTEQRLKRRFIPRLPRIRRSPASPVGARRAVPSALCHETGAEKGRHPPYYASPVCRARHKAGLARSQPLCLRPALTLALDGLRTG